MTKREWQKGSLGTDPYADYRDTIGTIHANPPDREVLVKAISTVLAHCDWESARVITEMLVDERMKNE